eukprot:2567336-Pleurochrysis_carterae.AAC.3
MAVHAYSTAAHAHRRARRRSSEYRTRPHSSKRGRSCDVRLRHPMPMKAIARLRFPKICDSGKSHRQSRYRAQLSRQF